MSRERGLRGRAAIVTGAAGDIGMAIAAALVRDGARVALLDRDGAALRARAAETFHADDPVLTLACDVADPEQTRAAVQQAAERWGAVHLLVNNAAAVTPAAAAADIEVADWNEALAVNLTGAWLMARWSIPHMIAAGGGVVVNIASQLGHVTLPGKAAYSVTKAGLIALARSIAVDHAKDGIRAVSLSPGAVVTGRLVARYGSAEAVQAALADKYPARRLATADEVARAVLFLASEDAVLVNGADLLADGGYSAT